MLARRKNRMRRSRRDQIGRRARTVHLCHREPGRRHKSRYRETRKNEQWNQPSGKHVLPDGLGLADHRLERIDDIETG